MSRFVIGICGDSGAGKTTLSEEISGIFFDNSALIISGDDLHKWERGHSRWNKFTHLNVEANNLQLGYKDLLSLYSGKDIRRKIYCHTSGKFLKPITIKPKDVIINEGLHTFVPKEILSIYNLKIFVKVDEPLRRHWKIIRDMKKRGYKKDSVLKSLDDRAADSMNFIMPQEKYADIIVYHQLESYGESFLQLQGDEQNVVKTNSKIICNNPLFYDCMSSEKYIDNIICCIEKVRDD